MSLQPIFQVGKSGKIEQRSIPEAARPAARLHVLVQLAKAPKQ
jgi:hypothetical protein